MPETPQLRASGSSLTLVEARAAGAAAAGHLERCKRVFREGDDWIAVIATTKVLLVAAGPVGADCDHHQLRAMRVVRREVVGRAR